MFMSTPIAYPSEDPRVAREDVEDFLVAARSVSKSKEIKNIEGKSFKT